MTVGASAQDRAGENRAAQDRAGHYAVLGISPAATAADITAAYRRAAKRVHPDVPGTGDRVAFLRLREAYQVLGDPDRRAAYDAEATIRAGDNPTWRQEERELPFVAPFAWRAPRFVGLAMACVTVLALGQVGSFLLASVRGWRSVEQAMSTTGAPAPLARQTLPPGPPPAAAQVLLTGADHFITAGSTAAVLWRRRAEGTGLERIGQVASFAAVRLLREADEEGWAEIRAPDGQSGLVEAARLQIGDARAARHAACLYNAGAPPRSGSLLVRPAGGPVRVTVENREERPAVFKLRDARDDVAAAVYIGPRGRAAIDQLPAGLYRAEFAVGDVWAAGCGMFMAGMRAQRLPQKQDLTGPASFSISAATVAEDISDDAFSHE